MASQTREQLTEKQDTVLGLIIANRGTTAGNICMWSHYPESTVLGTIVSLMHGGLVLRAYDEYPPCTYWPTVKAEEMYS